MALTGLLGTSASRPGDVQPGTPGSTGGPPPSTQRQVGGEGIHIDLQPPLLAQRQTDAVAAHVDVYPPQGLGPRADSVGLYIDVTFPRGMQYGAAGVMVDFVALLVPTTAVRWSGTAFEMGTSLPLTYWSAGAFRSSGTKPVVWVTDHFEEAP